MYNGDRSESPVYFGTRELWAVFSTSICCSRSLLVHLWRRCCGGTSTCSCPFRRSSSILPLADRSHERFHLVLHRCRTSTTVCHNVDSTGYGIVMVSISSRGVRLQTLVRFALRTVVDCLGMRWPSVTSPFLVGLLRVARRC